MREDKQQKREGKRNNLRQWCVTDLQLHRGNKIRNGRNNKLRRWESLPPTFIYHLQGDSHHLLFNWPSLTIGHLQRTKGYVIPSHFPVPDICALDRFELRIFFVNNHCRMKLKESLWRQGWSNWEKWGAIKRTILFSFDFYREKEPRFVFSSLLLSAIISNNKKRVAFEVWRRKKYNNLRVFIAVTPFGVVSVIQNLVRKNKIKTKAFLWWRWWERQEALCPAPLSWARLFLFAPSNCIYDSFPSLFHSSD